MTSRVIVGIPPVPFPINKKRTELVNVERPTGLGAGSNLGSGSLGLTSTDPVVRAGQLEQNIRFLQDQHALMLSGLHAEIETLRQRNRDLQFQLVFPNSNVEVLQQVSSEELKTGVQNGVVVNPSQGTITPVQIEILERDIAELRTNLSEARTRNVYLQNIVEEQKKKLSILENEKLDLSAVGKKIGKENKEGKPRPSVENPEEAKERLEDADRLIRRLRRENEEQRKEIVSLRSSISKSMAERSREASYGGNSNRSFYRNNQSQTSTRFPPLHSHNFWNGSKPGLDYSNGRQVNRGQAERDDTELVGRQAPLLPHLRDRNMGPSTSGYSNPAYNNYQGAGHNKNHHHRKQDGGRRPRNRDNWQFHRDNTFDKDKPT